MEVSDSVHGSAGTSNVWTVNIIITCGVAVLFLIVLTPYLFTGACSPVGVFSEG